jgi:hypothetical protein
MQRSRADGTSCVLLKTIAGRTIESTSQFFVPLLHNPVGVGQCRFFFSRSRWMGVKKWRVLPYIFRRVLLEGQSAGCWQHRNVLRACPCWSLVCPAPCPGASTPVATEECIAMHATVSCRHRTRPCPVTRLAWSHGLAYTVHGRIVNRGFPAVARRRAQQGGSSQPLAAAQETAHGRDTHVWTLCRDSL